MTSLNRDQYKEVDERLDNLIDNDYWSYGEDERSMIFTTKKIKDLFHSELEKVRQETIEEIWTWAVDNGITDKKSFVALRDYLKALSINKKEQ